MNRKTMTIYAFIILIFILELWQIYIQAKLAVENEIYMELQYQIEQMQKQNSVFKEQVLFYEAFITIEQEAKAEGFVPEQIYYLY